MSAAGILLVEVVNASPKALSMDGMAVQAAETVLFELSPFFRDPDGDSLEFAVSSTAMISAAVTESVIEFIARQDGIIAVTASDPGGLTVEGNLAVWVHNRIPKILEAIPGQQVFVGDAHRLKMSEYFSDPDLDSLSYVVKNGSPAIVDTEVTSDTLSITGLTKGSTDIKVSAMDPEMARITQVFTVVVPNGGPAFQPQFLQAILLESDQPTRVLRGPEYFTDPDGDPLTYRASAEDTSVARARVRADSITLTGVREGMTTLRLEAHDGEATVGLDVSVTVQNRPPLLLGELSSPREIDRDQEISVPLRNTFLDPEGDTLSFTVTSSDTSIVKARASTPPPWLRIQGMGLGKARVTVAAHDTKGLTAPATSVLVYVLEPPPPNEPPRVLRGAAINVGMVTEGVRELSLTDFFIDPEGEPLTYSAESSDTAVFTVSVRDSGLTLTAETDSLAAADLAITASDSENDVTVILPVAIEENIAPEYRFDEGIDTTTIVLGTDSTSLNLHDWFNDSNGIDVDPLTFTIRIPNKDGDALEILGGHRLRVPGDRKFETSAQFTVVGKRPGPARTIQVKAADTGGLETNEVPFVFRVENQEPNEPPALRSGVDIPDFRLVVDATKIINFRTYYEDPNGRADVLTFHAWALDTLDIQIEGSTSHGYATVTALQATSSGARIGIRATDAFGAQSAVDTIRFDIEENEAPIFISNRITTFSVHDKILIDLDDYFTDPNGAADALTYNARVQRNDRSYVRIEGDATYGDLIVRGLQLGRNKRIRIRAIDSVGEGSSLQTFLFSISSVADSIAVVVDTTAVDTTTVGENRPPQGSRNFSALPSTGVGSTVTYWARAFYDPDGDTLTYTAESADTLIGTVSITEVLYSGVPFFGRPVLALTGVSAGVTEISVTATDPDGESFVAKGNFQVLESTLVPSLNTGLKLERLFDQRELGYLYRGPIEAGWIIDAQLAALSSTDGFVVPGEEISAPTSLYFYGDSLTFDIVHSINIPPKVKRVVPVWQQYTEQSAELRVSGGNLVVKINTFGYTIARITASNSHGSVTATVLFPVAHLTNVGPTASAISNQTLSVSDAVSLNLADYFTDEEGHPMTYTVSSDSSSVGVALDSEYGSQLTVTGNTTGMATITVTARDYPWIGMYEFTGARVDPDNMIISSKTATFTFTVTVN